MTSCRVVLCQHLSHHIIALCLVTRRNLLKDYSLEEARVIKIIFNVICRTHQLKI